MVTFTKTLLLTDKTLAKYPLIAAALLGEPCLRERGKYTPRVQTAVNENPDFMRRFRIWREHLEAGPPPDNPPKHECLLLGVYDATTNEHQWVVQHHARLWAAKARLTEPLPSLVQKSPNQLQTKLLNDGFTHQVSQALPGHRQWEQTSEWIPSYQLLPGRPCLREKSDITERPPSK